MKYAQYEGAVTNLIEVTDSENKNVHQRKINNKIVLVVQACIYGHKVCALIDDGATWCFTSSGVVLPLGLKSTYKDTLLELGNGDCILSWGRVNDVLVVIVGLCVRLDLTITKLLDNIDVILGMNWLCTVNPIIHYQGAQMFLPDALGSLFLAGFWLDTTKKIGIVKVMQDKDEFAQIQKQKEIAAQISVLHTPLFLDV